MKAIILITSLACSTLSLAQQDPLTTLFWQNLAHFNPAISGLENTHFGAVTYRNQWDGVNGAPVHVFANYGTRLWENHGIGVVYAHDRIGYTASNSALINYNYQIKLKENHRISLGAAAGIYRLKSNPTWVPPSSFPDNSLPTGFSSSKFDANAGIAYTNNKLLVGLGVTHLTAPSLKSNTSTISFDVARHYYLNGAYKFTLGEHLSIKPQLLVRTDLIKMSGDFNVLATLKDNYWLGISYRQYAIAGMIGWDIKGKYRIGYAYDYPINTISNINRGSHEATLAFLLK